MAQSAGVASLTSFKALSFDCYGTLIDWERGTVQAMQPILADLPADHPVRRNPSLAVKRFNEISGDLGREQPGLVYNENLAMSVTRLCAEMNVPASDAVAEPFGNAPGTWAPFADTVAALQVLKKRYKLIILSNIHNTAIEATVGRQLAPVEFDAVYTAQDIGSYKPSHRNFQYLFGHAKKDLGADFEKGELLHVARSLTADHVPAKELGLPSVWICRGGDRPGGYGAGGDYEALKGKVGFGWKFETLGDFAEEVERQFAEAGKK
jgi:2-haloalkanoic acid dehalogenase type II